MCYSLRAKNKLHHMQESLFFSFALANDHLEKVKYSNLTIGFEFE